jgi:hypothetical protein
MSKGGIRGIPGGGQILCGFDKNKKSERKLRSSHLAYSHLLEQLEGLSGVQI